MSLFMIEHSKPTVGKEEASALLRVIKSNFLAEGDVVREFEASLSAYSGGKGAVAASTGTLALHLALVALGVGKGDEVIVPSYVCRSILNAVWGVQARAVLCDVSRDDYNILPEEVKKKITRKTRAVIVPHMFGCPADLDALGRLGVPLIEDCAHAIGAEYKGRKVGSFGTLAVFSFEGTKYITTGEGGMVMANTALLLRRLRAIKAPDGLLAQVKHTFRMTNLQAAVGLSQLKKLDSFISCRQALAQAYARGLASCDFVLPQAFQDRKHIYQRFMVRLPGRADMLMKKCLSGGVKVKRPVKPHPLHVYLRLSAKDFPHTAEIMRSAVSIPIYPSLTAQQIAQVVRVVSRAFLCDKKA